MKTHFAQVADRLANFVMRIGRENPKIWQRLDELRQARSRRGNWPEWCFLPEAALFELLQEFPSIAPQAATFQALSAWRATQGSMSLIPS